MRVSASTPDVRLAIVVPSEALARQWVGILQRETTLKKSEIGLLGEKGVRSLLLEEKKLEEKRVRSLLLKSY